MATENIKTRKAYRQGELLFIELTQQELSSIGPDTEHPQWNKLQTNVIREGEATGHKHEVITQRPGTATLMSPAFSLLRGLADMAVIDNHDRMLVAQEPVDVVHPEHKPLRLPIGIYLVIVQREYDEVKARRIMD